MTSVVLAAGLQAAAPEPQRTGTEAEFRGLHAPTDLVVWATGRNGVFSLTADGGRSWRSDTIPGGEHLFLVDVHAFDARSACVLGMSFDGGLARTYRTADGGRTWDVTYENVHPEVFFDGLAFWDDGRGVAFSDPVAGAFVVILSEDGCHSWTQVPEGALPAPLAGEAGFAASGTAISAFGTHHAWIGTGGAAVARVLRTTDGGHTWTAHDTPIRSGASAGIFGIAFQDSLHGLAVGGDHRARNVAPNNVIRTSDGGRTWEVVGTAAPPGVRYGVAARPDGSGTVVATGPPGYGYSLDWGMTWNAVDTASVNTVTISPGGIAWVAGVAGRVWRLTVPAALPR